jgi:hypothetical protein
MAENRLFGFRLWVRFFGEDGQPTVLFVPFRNADGGQGMKTVEGFNRDVWHFLVCDARRDNRLDFAIEYRYEPLP